MFRIILLIAALSLMAAAPLPDAPPLHPSPAFTPTGPGQARGVLVWLHGSYDTDAQPSPPAEPAWVTRLARRGYDIWRYDRTPGQDPLGPGGEALLRGLAAPAPGRLSTHNRRRPIPRRLHRVGGPGASGTRRRRGRDLAGGARHATGAAAAGDERFSRSAQCGARADAVRAGATGRRSVRSRRRRARGDGARGGGARGACS